MTETVGDGRVARGRRTREAVIDVLLILYREGNLTPTIEDIASRVGMTPGPSTTTSGTEMR